MKKKEGGSGIYVFRLQTLLPSLCFMFYDTRGFQVTVIQFLIRTPIESRRWASVHLCGLWPSGLWLGWKEWKGQRWGRDMADLRSWGCPAAWKSIWKAESPSTGRTRGLSGEGWAGQCQNTEEQPPSRRDCRERGGWEDAGLVQGRAAWEQRGFCKLPCLHHRHPENKCKQRDPALQEPPTQPPPRRHYPMPSKS